MTPIDPNKPSPSPIPKEQGNQPNALDRGLIVVKNIADMVANMPVPIGKFAPVGRVLQAVRQGEVVADGVINALGKHNPEIINVAAAFNAGVLQCLAEAACGPVGIAIAMGQIINAISPDVLNRPFSPSPPVPNDYLNLSPKAQMEYCERAESHGNKLGGEALLKGLAGLGAAADNVFDGVYNFLRNPQDFRDRAVDWLKDAIKGPNAAFEEALEALGLGKSFRAGEGDEIGGVGNKVGMIEGLFDKYDCITENEHLFYIPTIDGKPPFTNPELQQILRELTVGIYVHDTIPCFSLHFDSHTNLYPVIHPIYQNTLVGRVIGMLDYYMKGFLNGGYFREKYVQEWQATKTQDPEKLKPELVDIHELCQQHIGSDQPYYSIRELLDVFERQDQSKATEELDPASAEAPIFSDYSGFRSSFRIIAKQNSIKKSENLFSLDGGFDVFSSIEPDAVYKEELRKYRYQFGEDPAGYKRLARAYGVMKVQIETMMPKLPEFRELFEMLNVINFFCYYLKSLKRSHKVPFLESKQTNPSFTCPPLFPHLPVRRMIHQGVTVNWAEVFETLADENKKKVNGFLKTGVKGDEPPKDIVDAVLKSFRDSLQKKLSFPLSIQKDALETQYAKVKCYLINLLEKSKYQIKKQQQMLFRLQDDEAGISQDIQQQRESLVSIEKTYSENISKAQAGIAELENIIASLPQRRDSETEGHRVTYMNALGGQQQLQQQNLTTLEESYQKELRFYQESLDRANNDLEKICEDARIQGGNLEKINTFRATQLADYNEQFRALMAPVNVDREDKIAGINLFYQTEYERLKVEHSNDLEAMNDKIQDDLRRWDERIALNQQWIFAAGLQKEETLKGILENIQRMEKDQGAIPEKINEQENILDTLIDTCKGDPDFPWDEENQVLQLFKEMPKAERKVERKTCKRIVGGCGLDLKSLPVTVEPLGQQILNQSFADLLDTKNEELKAVRLNSEKTDGYIFRLQLVDFHASKDKDYGWMQFLSQEELLGDFLKNRQLFTSVYENNEIGFDVGITQQTNLQIKDRQGISLAHYAASSTSKRYLELLIEKKVPLNVQDPLGYTPLHYAVKEGSLEHVRLLLKCSPEMLDQPAKNNVTPFYLAVQYGQFEIIQFFLANFKEININIQASHGMTPLYCAIHHGFDKIVIDLLARSDLIIDLAMEDGTTPLYCATEKENEVIVQCLLNAGANPSLCKIDGYAPLHIVAKKGKKSILGLFLRHIGLIVDQKLPSGQTALHLAAMHNSHECVELLLKSNANTELCSWGGQTALLAAILNGNALAAECIIEFVKNGKVINAADISHQTPLKAALEGRLCGVVERLLKYQVMLPSTLEFVLDLCKAHMDPLLIQTYSATLNDAERKTALYNAAKHGHNQMVSHFLLVDGVPDFEEDEQYWSLAHFAAKYDHVNVIQQFIKSAAAPALSYKDKERNTLAAIAAEHGSRRVLKLLLDAMAKHLIQLEEQARGSHLLVAAIEAGEIECADLIIHKMSNTHLHMPLDKQGRHATHLAAKNGDVEMLELLKSRGFRFDQATEKGKTAFHYVFEYQWDDAIDYLLDEKHEFNVPADLLLFATRKGKGNARQIKKLVKRGLRIDPAHDKKVTAAKNKRKDTIFHRMVRKGEKLDLSLLDDPLVRDDKGVSVLHLCAAARFPGQLSKVIEKCKNKAVAVNVVDKKGKTPLFYAIETKNKEHVEILLKKGANPNHMTHKRWSPLFSAVVYEQPFIIRLLLDYGAKINQTCLDSKITCLHQAIVTKLFEIARFLISQGADINKPDLDGTCPIHYAAAKGNLILTNQLHLAGASLKIADNAGNTVAHYAAISKNPALLEALKEWGVSLDQQTKISVPSLRLSHEKMEGMAPLHQAAIKGNVLMLKKLISLGCNLELLDAGKRGVLFYASSSGSKKLVKCLSDYRLITKSDQRVLAIKAGIQNDLVAQIKPFYQGEADIFLDSVGTTGLHVASIQGALNCSHYLLKQGADPKRANANGETPFVLAVKNKRLAHVRELVQTIPDFDVQEKRDGQTYLHLACEGDDPEMASLLIQLGIDLNATDPHALTALDYAAKQGSYPLLHLLLACGAEERNTIELTQEGQLSDLIEIYQKRRIAGKKMKEGRLHLAVRCNDQTHLPLLLRMEDLEGRNVDGLSPLHLAVKEGRLNIARMMLDQGSDLEAKDQLGRTPLLMMASDGNDPELASFLLRAKANPKAESHHQETALHLITQRPYNEATLELFDLFYQYLPEQELSYPSKTMLSAIKNQDLKLFYQCVNQGHPIKKLNFNLLQQAVSWGSTPIVEALVLWFQVDIDLKDLHGSSPLSLAIHARHLNLATFLVYQGAKIDPLLKNQLDALSQLQQDIHQKVAAFDSGWRNKLSEFAVQKGLKRSIPPSLMSVAAPVIELKPLKIVRKSLLSVAHPLPKVQEMPHTPAMGKVVPSPTKITSSKEDLLSDWTPKTNFSIPLSGRNNTVGYVENGPVGLINLGFSCYLNAILQMLFNIPEIRSLIEQQKNNLLTEQLFALLNIKNATATETPLKELRNEIFRRAGRGELLGGELAQHDAHEAMMSILSHLNWFPMEVRDCYKEGDLVHLANIEPRNIISMELKDSERAINFQTIVDECFLEEHIKESIIFQVNGSNHQSDQWRKAMQIVTPPAHLIVQLKRFDFAGHGRKIVTPVAFPEVVQFPYGDVNIQYDIIAFVNHVGSTMDMGHYTTDLKNFRDPEERQRWIHCDDNDVRESVQPSISKNAYLVLLKRREV